MIKILPDNKDFSQARGVSMMYRSIIQQQLSKSIRREVAECLSDTKNWITIGTNLVDTIDYQCMADKYTKILYVDNQGQKLSVHCQCRYSWRATERWQYGYAPDSKIWVLKKFITAGCDYLAIINRHLNQLILIPRLVLLESETRAMSVLNKLNGKYKNEQVYLVNFYENENLEYFSRQYGKDGSAWIKRTLKGK